MKKKSPSKFHLTEINILLHFYLSQLKSFFIIKRYFLTIHIKCYRIRVKMGSNVTRSLTNILRTFVITGLRHFYFRKLFQGKICALRCVKLNFPAFILYFIKKVIYVFFFHCNIHLFRDCTLII